jgi:hypothetical protein
MPGINAGILSVTLSLGLINFDFGKNIFQNGTTTVYLKYGLHSVCGRIAVCRNIDFQILNLTEFFQKNHTARLILKIKFQSAEFIRPSDNLPAAEINRTTCTGNHAADDNNVCFQNLNRPNQLFVSFNNNFLSFHFDKGF